MKKWIYHLIVFIVVFLGAFACTKQDTRILKPGTKGIAIEERYGERYSSPVTITDLIFIQDDVRECAALGVAVADIDILIGDDWVRCEKIGSAWWVRDICHGEGTTSVHLHDFAIRTYLTDGRETWTDMQKVLFFPVHPGKYNEYRFRITEKLTFEIEIGPGFAGDK